MSLHTFDVVKFREQFPEFKNPTTYPDAQLQGYWDVATAIIDPNDNCFLKGNQLQQALNLLTAHLAKLYSFVDKGKTVGLLQGATVDKVSVTLTPPPLKTGYQWWLAQTPYGAQLWALTQAITAGGFWFGGLPELSSFRKTAGVF